VALVDLFASAEFRGNPAIQQSSNPAIQQLMVSVILLVVNRYQSISTRIAL
jgi:hypothetical protein